MMIFSEWLIHAYRKIINFAVIILPVKNGIIKTDNIGKSTFSVFKCPHPDPPLGGEGEGPPKSMLFSYNNFKN